MGAGWDPRSVPADVLAAMVGDYQSGRLGGGSMMSGSRGPGPGGGAAPGGPLRIAQLVPFEQLKPPSGIDLHMIDRTQALAPSATLVFTGNLTIPTDYEGNFAYINVFIDAMTTLTSVAFDVLFNGIPQQGMQDLGPFPRNANSFSQVYPFTTRMPSNTIVTARARNLNANGPWNVGVEMGGWAWSRPLRLRIFGESE